MTLQRGVLTKFTMVLPSITDKKKSSTGCKHLQAQSVGIKKERDLQYYTRQD